MNRSVIVFGPSGCGKTTEAVRLAKYFGLSRIADGADLSKQPTHRGWDVDHLFLVQKRPPWTAPDDRRVIAFHDAIALAKAADA